MDAGLDKLGLNQSELELKPKLDLEFTNFWHPD